MPDCISPSESCLMVCPGCVSELYWKISSQVEPRVCLSLYHLILLTNTVWIYIIQALLLNHSMFFVVVVFNTSLLQLYGTPLGAISVSCCRSKIKWKCFMFFMLFPSSVLAWCSCSTGSRWTLANSSSLY